jgi:hypothetical protein
LDVSSASTQLEVAVRTLRAAWRFPLKDCWVSTRDGIVNERLESERKAGKCRQDRAVKGAEARWKKDAKAMLKHDDDVCLSNDQEHAQAFSKQCDQKKKKKEEILRSSEDSGSPPSSTDLLFKSSLKISNGKKGSVPGGGATWLATGVSWKEFCAGLRWNNDAGVVVISESAGLGLREHLEKYAEEKRLPMMTGAQVIESFDRLNEHLPNAPHKRGKNLPITLRGWAMRDLRHYGAQENKNGNKGFKTKHAAHLAEVDEYIARKDREAEREEEVDTFVDGGNADDGGQAEPIWDRDMGQDAD